MKRITIKGLQVKLPDRPGMRDRQVKVGYAKKDKRWVTRASSIGNDGKKFEREIVLSTEAMMAVVIMFVQIAKKEGLV